MATGADVRDILELAGGENDGPISKKDLINSDKVRDKSNFFNIYYSYSWGYTGHVTKRRQQYQCHSNILDSYYYIFESITKMFLLK